MNPWATGLILPALLHEIKTAGKWQVKTGSLIVLNQLVVSAPLQTSRLMPDIVPILAEAIWDTKARREEGCTRFPHKGCCLGFKQGH
jgi:elongation factor 3